MLPLLFAVSTALAQSTFVDRLNEIPTPERLRAWHDMVASEPHIAGTEGDARQIDRLARAFTDMGLEVDVHEIWPLLSYPVSAEVEILHPTIEPGKGLLPLKEQPLAGDPYSSNADLTIGFNAYSASGEAIGEVVYANYGTKQDFETLAEMGIDCTGKIVIARFGGNYRGYKAKFAEAAGAAGLLIFIDPGDSGYAKGEVYPEGGWQTDQCIQRGSIKTLAYQGDPLTPFVEATEDAERLDPDEIALPKIPVQPIGWGAARQIIVRMEGPEAPEKWRGGLPMSYPITGGADLRVRVNVQQDRRIAKTANVIARIEGEIYPDQWVIVGCHHDAWNCGAADPTCGLIALLESARSFAELAKQGQRPARTVIFCGWAAEEFGIIGSTEWVEANYDELREKAVAYINLDMASMGPSFHASATPSVTRLVEEAARLVPQARAPEKTVFDDWLSRSPRGDDSARPRVGNLGGGSDHVAFVCYAGIPAIALGGGGSDGSSYHTAYDNLNWYRQVVGEDYEPALMVARMTNAVAGKLASDERLPFDVTGTLRLISREMRRFAADPFVVAQGYAGAAAKNAEDADSLVDKLEALEALSAASHGTLVFDCAAWLERHTAPSPEYSPEDLARLRSSLRRLVDFRWHFGSLARKHWTVSPVPEPDGTRWYRSMLVSPDPSSGYGSWVLPDMRGAIEDRDADRVGLVLGKFMERLDFLNERVSQYSQVVEELDDE